MRDDHWGKTPETCRQTYDIFQQTHVLQNYIQLDFKCHDPEEILNKNSGIMDRMRMSLALGLKYV